MIPGPLKSSAGFTYIAALFMVAVMGIMLGAIGQSVKVIMQREREKELIFRGLQYRDAIERWNKVNAGKPLNDLKDLYEPVVSNNVNASKDKFIRKLYKDPITGGEWKALKPPSSTQGIYGVASTSDDVPIKQGNFPEVIKDFDGKQKYSEWEFIFKVPPATAKGAPAAQQPQQFSLPLSTPEGN